MARNPRHHDPVLVIGLGRFGSALATSLMDYGHEVLGADMDGKITQSMMGKLTHVVQLDSTSTEALGQIGADQFTRAVVGIGTDLEASILTVAALEDLGVPEIWAKALSETHATILRRVGADYVVQPEADMGKRIARRVVSRAQDFFEFEDGFSLIQTDAPEEVVGHTIGEVPFSERYGITVVCVKRRNTGFEMAQEDTMIQKGDILIVAGRTQAAQAFSER